jgi:hypothetical protein
MMNPLISERSINPHQQEVRNATELKQTTWKAPSPPSSPPDAADVSANLEFPHYVYFTHNKRSHEFFFWF